jgi:hypothetical protein
MSDADPKNSSEIDEGKPPFFSSWNGMYLLVLGALAIQVTAYWLISRIYG